MIKRSRQLDLALPRSLVLLSLTCLLLASAVAGDATSVPLLIAERVDANNHSVERNTTSRKVIDYLALKSGVHFELHAYPWKRALLLAEAGESAIWGVTRTPEREQLYAFSHPVFSKNIWMIVRRDDTSEIKSIADLAGKHISLFRGASYSAEFQKARATNIFSVEEDTNSWEIRFSKLLAGRCDVMLAAATVSNAQKAQHFFEGLGYDPKTMRVLDKPLFADTLHIAILKSRLADFPMTAINNAIDAGHADIERLIDE